MPTISLFYGIAIQMFWQDHAPLLEWAKDHRAALMEDWNLCAANQHPKKIPPLR
jgi:hypothetical protein